MIDIERLKVDAAYWDESIDRSVIAVQILGLNLHPCFFTKIGLDCFIEQGGDESQLIYRPQPSPASLLTDEQAEARMGEPVVIERKSGESPKYPHYFKDVSGVDAIDLYHVAKLYEINDPALFHAFKKIACAGKRGAKDQAQDVQEAIDALKRWQELNK